MNSKMYGLGMRRGFHKGDLEYPTQRQEESQDCGATKTKRIKGFRMEKLLKIVMNVMIKSIVYHGGEEHFHGSKPGCGLRVTSRKLENK